MGREIYTKELIKLRKEKKVAESRGRSKEQADYCNTIGALLSRHGDFEGALSEHQEELALCEAQNDSIGQAVAHRKLGEALCELGRAREALAHHTRFLEAAQRQSDRLEEQRATATVGRTYLLMAESESSQGQSKAALLEKAEKWFQKSLKIVPSVTGLQERERAEMTARLHINLGIVADTSERAQQAQEHYTQATAVSERFSLLEDGRRAHDLLALTLQAAGDDRGALQHLQVALRLAEKLQDTAARTDSLHTRAQVLVQMGDADGASRAWYKAYKLKSPDPEEHAKHARCLRYALRIVRAEDRLLLLSADDHQGRCRRHERLGDCYCRLGAHKQALQHYMQQLKCTELLGWTETARAPVLASVAATHKDMRQYSDSAEWYRRELRARDGNAAEMCETLMNLADLETSMGSDVSSICELYRQAADVAAEAGLAKQRAFALRDMALTYAENGRAEDEARVRRDLELALKCDRLPDNWDRESEPESQESEQQADGSDSQSGEDIDISQLSGMSSEGEETPPDRRRRRAQAGRQRWNHRNTKGETPLHLACIQGKHKQVARLLQQGHPVNPRDYSGWLPLHEAANFGHLAVVRLLLEQGALVSDPGGAHCGGTTPLHDAAGNGHLVVARALLDAGADAAARNQQGETPLEYLMVYQARSGDSLTEEAAADLRALEDEMKHKLRQEGRPIPASPSVRLLQSPSVRDTGAATDHQPESESPAGPPPVMLSEEEEDEADASAAYRRAIRAVGKSAVSATPTAKTRRAQRPAAGRGAALVGEAEYQWLEEDLPEAAARRRRRRLSPVFQAASARPDRPAAAATSCEQASEPSACSQRPLTDDGAQEEGASSRTGGGWESPVVARRQRERSTDETESEPLLVTSDWAATEQVWDDNGTDRGAESPTTRRGSEPDSPSPEPEPRLEPEPEPVIEMASSDGEDTPARPCGLRRSRKRPRQTRLTPLVMRQPRRGESSRSNQAGSPSPSPTMPTKMHRASSASAQVAPPSDAGSGQAAPPEARSSKDGWFSPTLRVFVQVGSDRLMVPVPAGLRQSCTIGWLAQQTSDRYYRQFLLRPRLELCTAAAGDRPAVPLDPDDAVRDVISGPDDLLDSRVTGWERPPLTQRYTAACAALHARGVAAVASQLSACQSSGRLQLSDLGVTVERLRPLLRAVQRYSCVVQLHLRGNPLRDEGVQELSAALPHLFSLETLDLTLVKMTTAGLRHLTAVVGDGAALQACSSLSLAYNMLWDSSSGALLASLLSALPRLTSLDLSACQLTAQHVTQHRDSWAAALSDSSLSELRLGYNPALAPALAALLRCTRADRLRRLVLSGSSVRLAALRSLTEQCHRCALRHLELADCRLTDTELPELCSLFLRTPDLAVLDLSENASLSASGGCGLLSSALAAGCPLSRLQLAGCAAGQLQQLLDAALAAARSARELSLPAAQHVNLCRQLKDMWSGRWQDQARAEVTEDGDLLLSLAEV